MTLPTRIALARFVLAGCVVVLVALASLPGAAGVAADAFRALVAVLRTAGHGLLAVEDGFVTAMAVTLVTIPLPGLVARAIRASRPVPTWGATGWAALATGVVGAVLALRSATPLATWVSIVVAAGVGLPLGALVLGAVRELGREHRTDATPRSRRLAMWLTAVYAVGVLLVGFTGSPVDAGAHPAIVRVLAALHRAGLPAWFGYGALEFSANVVFFLPLGLLVVLLLGAHRWWVGAAAGLLVSAAIETGQALFLPARFASFDDVLANTSGAVIGALLGAVALGARRRTRDVQR